MSDALLKVEGLKTVFHTSIGTVRAVDDVSLSIAPGEVLGLVGESGCGKSVLSMSILRLIPIPPGQLAAGRVMWRRRDGQGVDLLKLSSADLRRVRGAEIAMIFQEPMTSLNPVMTVGRQMAEVFEIHTRLSPAEIQTEILHLLKMVGIPSPEERVEAYPHELSGGMRQRVMIAMAIACKPALLIADEPTTALDVTIQAQILALLRNLQQELKMSMLLITHDLGVVAQVADRVAVMYAGSIVEEGPVKEIFAAPRHPYTKALLESIPSLSRRQEGDLHTIPGRVPNLAQLPVGCRFQDRCPYVQDKCRASLPLLEGDGHRVRCYYPVNRDSK